MATAEVLLREVHDASVPLSVLLRKALVIAHSAGDGKFRTWLNWELNGYGPAKDIPEYRRPRGMILGRDRFGRTLPVLFRPEQADLEELMCSPSIPTSIPALEAELRVHASEETIETTIAPTTMKALRQLWGVEDAHMHYSIAAFHAVVEGARTRLVSFLVTIQSHGEQREPAREPSRSRSPIAWFRALNGLWQFVIGLATIVAAIPVVLALGPCKPRSAPTVPPDSTAVDSLYAGSSSAAHARSSAAPQPWRPPPYAPLRIKGLRSDPVEFKLWGDSVIVDVVMELADSTSRQWPADRATKPLMKFEVHSTRVRWYPGVVDEWTQVGQWVVAEKDRAVFVVRSPASSARTCASVPASAWGTHRATR